MPCGSIMHLERSSFDKWKKGKKFLNLTRLDFSGCEYLRETVDFSAIPNLEVMDLNRCKNLKRIDVSIGNLKKLQTLNLSKCCSLTSLPSLAKNQCLESIDLDFCSEIHNLPNLPTTLTRLSMSGSGIKEIPLSIGNLINLEYISASYCKNLICFSNSIFKLPNLRKFNLAGCPNLSQLSEAESSMVSSNLTSTYPSCIYLISFYQFSINLQQLVLEDFPNLPYYPCCLDLTENNFVSLRINNFKCINITHLKLFDCEWLVEIPELPHTLQFLDANNCKSLVKFSQFQFICFNGDFRNCHKMGDNEMQSWREMVENLSSWYHSTELLERP